MEQKRIKTYEECIKDCDPNFFASFFPLARRRYLGAPLDLLPKNFTYVTLQREEFLTTCTENDYKKYSEYLKEYDAVINKIHVERETSGVFHGLRLEYDGKTALYVCEGPTFNCQLASIAGFENLLGSTLKQSEMEIILRHIAYTIGKYQFYFDIRDILRPIVDRLCFDKINPVPYISTNGSHMYDGKLLINR